MPDTLGQVVLWVWGISSACILGFILVEWSARRLRSLVREEAYLAVRAYDDDLDAKNAAEEAVEANRSVRIMAALGEATKRMPEIMRRLRAIIPEAVLFVVDETGGELVKITVAVKPGAPLEYAGSTEAQARELFETVLPGEAFLLDFQHLAHARPQAPNDSGIGLSPSLRPQQCGCIDPTAVAGRCRKCGGVL